ncbi:MAG: hypothetical protein WC810_27860 [Janthinobacterium sp.]|jgi:hypothetical protein
MNKVKITSLIISLAIVILLGGYFFMPKTLTKCGSVLPMSCQACKCSMGIPYSSNSIGGSGVNCFMGKLLECKATGDQEDIQAQPQEPVNDSSVEVLPELSCAKVGETIGAYGMPTSCCLGLKRIGGWPGGYTGDCTLLPPPTGLQFCSECGNGVCDVNNGENVCNCKEDCKLTL